MAFKEKIFREYDIRGVVGEEIDAELAWALGKAFGEVTLRDNPAPDGQTVVGVGYDCRLSGPQMREALCSGLLAAGVNVLDCGMGPTPQLYFSVFHKELQGGIQITASHNPGDQNGFKMMIGSRTLSGEAIQELRRMSLKEVASAHQKDDYSSTSTLSYFDARSAYIEELYHRSLPHVNKQRRIKVVVDGGNGVGGLVGPEVLRRLGCEVIEIFTEPDGRFPNHHPDPTVLENLKDLCETVVREGADLGIAWDGDADRIGVVDEKGNAIFGDMLLVILGRQLLKEVPQPIIIADVKCSDQLFSTLEREGARVVMAKTGHSLIKGKMKELGAHLAGEMSGHVFFSHRYYGFDDALHTAARLIEILSQTPQKMSELLHGIPQVYNTPEIRFDCADDIKFKVVEEAKKAFAKREVVTIDGLRVRFDEGWGLVRASNTQPALVLRFEAENELALKEYQELFDTTLKQIVASVAAD